MSPQVTGRWSAQELGLPAHATFRCLHVLPCGGMALGTDRGMVLYRKDAFLPFPFPAGARQESRRVESLAVFDGRLFVASATTLFTLRLEDLWSSGVEARGVGYPRDAYGVIDDLRLLHVWNATLLRAWRTHFEGAEGPPDVTSIVESPDAIWAGSLEGELWQLDTGPVRRFTDPAGRHQPVRYLAWCHDTLWVAAAGALHRLERGRWTERVGEPYDLHTDSRDRLWVLEKGGLYCADGSWPEPVTIPLDRPWTLASDSDGQLWVGELGRITRMRI